MLLAIHNTLQRLIYERGHINPHEVAIQFEAPTRERIDKLTRPTVNLFLFDMQENTELRQSNYEITRNNGRAERRLVPRRFDLRYMVSALTTAVEDEHQLLWRILVTLVQHPLLPADLLSDDLRTLDPPLTTRVSQTDEGLRLSNVWSALSVPPHPAIYYVVTAPVDMNQVIEAPLVLTRTARYLSSLAGEKPVELGTQVGGVVQSSEGQPLANVTVSIEGRTLVGSVTDEQGRFVLHGVSPGPLRLRITQADGSHKIVTMQVPGTGSGDASYDERVITV